MDESHIIPRVEFTPEMKKTHTILVPDMLPIHIRFLCDVFESAGYKLEHLTNSGRAIVDAGLKYVHNDTCYPALLVIGQFIDALSSGKYDLSRVAVIITQTGGGCRASNYLSLMRKAFVKAGFGHVPIISLNFAGLEKNSGFKFTPDMLPKALGAVVYGDMLMLLNNQVRPYEKNKGESLALVDSWVERLSADFRKNKGLTNPAIRKNFRQMVREFAAIPRVERKAIKVGIVGEIYVKYSPMANNNLEEFLISQGCEVNVPGLMGFLLFFIDHRHEDHKLYGCSLVELAAFEAAKALVKSVEKIMIDVIKEEGTFTPPMLHDDVRKLTEPVISFGCKMGEGWCLTAEMLELAEHGFENIICTQPFGCLPNHISGKGMVRKVKQVNPKANIVCIDYDPGATSVNQENRIKLMLAVAAENMEKE
ncbi:MAG: 2-hydroxyglutaryl-CoA dehydratase [Acutalibacteraceae bacterium]|nr:2-hydroxyacyl-CoA dehydratase [Oscillospiraceae bacterium]